MINFVMFPYYPESYHGVVSIQTDGNVILTVVKTEMGHHCGYVRFKGKQFMENNYKGFLNYVPVHGGITYAEMDDDGTMCYGFDCNHVDDSYFIEGKLILKPQNPLWVAEETHRMYVGLMVAKKYEQAYLTSESDEDKVEIIDEYHKQLKEMNIKFNLTNNFGAMLNVLAGRI